MVFVRKPLSVALGAALTLSAMWSPAALGQAATVPPLPRNNVSASAIATRRPGLWIEGGLATTGQRISTSITNFGGVEYTQEGPPPSFRDEVIPALVDVLLGVIDQFSLLIQTLIQGGTLPTAGG